jgi:organic radical activating enzyme
MGLPLNLTIKMGTYLLKQKILRRDKFPLIVEVEPLFACNLACAGCGKIQHPASVLKQRMPVQQVVDAVEEAGAPMVSLAGGEPLMHPQIDEMTRALLGKGKFVVLCTNAVLLPKHLHKFKPHRNFAWMVHIDGLRERHDESVSKDGVFDQAIEAIRQAKAAGFAVYTNSTFFQNDSAQDVIEVLQYLNDDLKVDRMQISPGYAYEKAPDLAAQPLRALPGLPGREDRLRVHPVGDPLVLAQGLAEALLPDGGRLHGDLQGAPGDHRLGELRPGQGPALRQLHGALRLRADGRAGDHGLAQGEPPRPHLRLTGPFVHHWAPSFVHH